MDDSQKTKAELISELQKLRKTHENCIQKLENERSQSKLAEKILYDMIARNPISIQILDKDGYSISVNEAHSKFFGAIPPEGYSVFKDPQLKEQGLADAFEQLQKGEAVFFPETSYNAHLVNPKFPDKTVWIKTLGFPVFDGEGKPERYIIMHENITENKTYQQELKERNKQLRQLTRYIQQKIEEERKRLSQELHDGLGQEMAAIKLDLGIIINRFPHVEMNKELKDVSRHISKLMQLVNDTTALLRPELIKHLGIEAAIKWYSGRVARRCNLDVLLHTDPDIEMPNQVALQLFRIMQEALSNVAKHSHATKVEIDLVSDKRAVHFVISDNGKGISDKKMKSKQSFGLLIMKERASSIGASFSITSASRKGTRIDIVIPAKKLKQ